MLDRREFMMRGVALGSVLALPRWTWAQGMKKEPGARTLVMLHLNGGNDGLNTVVPYKDRYYRVLRPALGLDLQQATHQRDQLRGNLQGLERRTGHPGQSLAPSQLLRRQASRGEHEIKDLSQGVEIGASVDLLPLYLFRRHVGDRADGGAGAGERRVFVQLGGHRGVDRCPLG